MKNIFLLLTFSAFASIVQVELLFSENISTPIESTSQLNNVTVKTLPPIVGNNEVISFNEHIVTKYVSQGITSILSINEDFNVDTNENTSLKLASNEDAEYTLDCCDTEDSVESKNFIGSVFVPRKDKN